MLDKRACLQNPTGERDTKEEKAVYQWDSF
jgi:hypothetical protein